MENPELGAGSVLNQCEKEGKKLTKWELCRVVKELRKFKRFKQALEVKIFKNLLLGHVFLFTLNVNEFQASIDFIF